MKKILLFGLSPTLLLFIVSSCQKETITKTSSASKVSTEINSLKNQNLRVWYDNGNDNYGCWLAGGNCLDDVVVTPWFGIHITNFANSSSQVEFASTNYSTLSEVIDESLLDGVIAGDLSVSMKGSITSTRVGYLIFKFTSGGSIKVVNPFKL